MSFQLFDPDEDVRITAGRLPHWYQPGATYFVTFRTGDSIPRSVGDLWQRRRNDWLQRHGINPDGRGWQRALRALPELQQWEFHSTFSREFMEHLDAGYGECVLQRRELAKIVAASLLYFDGDRYAMGDFVVMPNHVHLLVGLLGQTDIEEQCRSWKKYTATRINRALRRRGEFWQTESFDHLVRSPEQFEYFQRYIADNPRKGRLNEDQYLYYQYGDVHVRQMCIKDTQSSRVTP